MGLSCVSGTAIGIGTNGELCIKILTDNATAGDRSQISERLSEVPVTFEETGQIDAL